MKTTRRFLMAIFASMLPLAAAWADNVAKIGETQYASLAEAIAVSNEATNATTIALIANTTVTETITLNPAKTVTLDLAGFTLTSQLNTLSPLFKLTKGSLIIKDSGTTKGGITGTGIIFRIDSREESSVTSASKASVTVNSDVNVTSTDSPCAFIRGYATFTTNGNLTSSGLYATIQGNGSDTQGSVININGGIVKSNESNAVYHPQKGTLNVKNAAIVEGVSSGIAIKAGTLSIAGGTIKATGASNIPTSGWSNGIEASGCAIQIESNTDYDANGVSVSISGTPTIESVNGAAVYEYVGKGDATKLTRLKVTGGTFKAATGKDAILLSQQAADANVTAVSGGSFSSVIPDAYCAEGYAPVTTQDENGLYTVAVTEESGVASITRDGKTTYYLTVTSALSAAQDGETVTMQKDYTSSALSSAAAQLTAQKSITLDLNGHTIEHTNSKNALYVSGSSGKKPIIIVKNGTVKSNATAIKAGANAIVTIENDVTVIGSRGIEVGGGQTTLTTTGTITGTEAGIYIAGGGTSYSNKIVNVDGGTISGQYGIYSNQATTVNVNDGIVTGTVAAIALNGYQAYSSTSDYTIKLNITGGNVAGTDEGWAIAGSGNENKGNYEISISGGTVTSDDCAIYHCNDGVLTVSGGTITGTTAIYQKSGTLNISGGTINGTGASDDYSYNGNGANSTGDAVVVDNCGYPGGKPVPSITGGTINSTNGSPVASYYGSTQTEAIVGFVSGGTYNKAIADDLCAEGYIVSDNGNGTFDVKIGSYVAQIGDKKYETLQAAFAATVDGNTVTLLTDVALTDRLFVNAGATPAYAGTNNRYATTSENKSITLELNGYNVTTSSNIALAGGSLNIVNNGTADATHGVISTTNDGLAPIEIRGTGDLAQKRTLTVGTGVTLSGAAYGMNVFGSNNEQKNIIDVNVNGTVNGTLFVLGNLKNAENEININVAGTVAGPDNGDNNADVGIALNGNATVNVNTGAQISGETGIEVRAGQLNVNGGTITATAAQYSEKPNGSGSCTQGAAIAVAQHTTQLPITTTLSGGILNGVKKLVVTDVENIGLTNVEVTATTAYTQQAEIPEGYKWVSNGDGTSSLAPCEYVAQVGEQQYESLAAAIEAAADGNTVTLLKDVVLTDRLFVNAGATPAYAGTDNRYATTSENKSITLELNGYNVTSSSNIALAGGSLNIVNNGTADEDHGVISTTNDGLAPIEIRGTGDLAQKRTLTVGTGVTLSGAAYGLNVFGSNNEQKNIIDVNVNGTVNGTLFVLGNLKNAENEININVAGTVAGPDNNDNNADVGIALNGNATVNVNNGAQISGETGIEVRAGQLNVNGGTIKATAAQYSEKPNGSGSCTQGAAIAVAQHTTQLPITTTLSGGTLNGVKKLVVTDVENIGLTNVEVTATTAYTQQAEIPEGYAWKDNGNGTCTLVAVVATVNGTGYLTFADAVTAAAGTDDITLLADVEDAYTLAVDETLKVALNGHTLTVISATGGYEVNSSVADGVTTYTLVQVDMSDEDVVLYDGEPYTYINNTQVKSATYVRSFSGSAAGKYKGWFVPFDYVITSEAAELFDFFKINMIANSPIPGETTNPKKIWIFLEPVEVDGTLHANRPYAYRLKAEKADLEETAMEFRTNNVLLKAPDASSRLHMETAVNAYDFYGVYDHISPSSSEPLYYVGSESISWSNLPSLTIKSYRWVMKATIKETGDVESYSRSVNFVDGSEDDATAIHYSVIGKDEIEGYYTLDGVKVQNPGKGVYVVRYANGQVKKVSLK